MVFKLDSNGIVKPADVLIRGLDTDIVIAMLSNMAKLKVKEIKIWMQCGPIKKQRQINISEIYVAFVKNICLALAGLHAFTGCDSNLSIHGMGKTKPFDVIIGTPRFTRLLLNLPILR